MIRGGHQGIARGRKGRIRLVQREKKIKYVNDEGTRGAEKSLLNPELSSVSFIATQRRLKSEHPRKQGRLVSLLTENLSSRTSWRALGSTALYAVCR